MRGSSACNASSPLEAVEAGQPSRGATEGVRLASPHSSATVDLDGDCVADLMLVTLRAGATEPSCAHQARAALSYA